MRIHKSMNMFKVPAQVLFHCPHHGEDTVGSVENLKNIFVKVGHILKCDANKI